MPPRRRDRSQAPLFNAPAADKGVGIHYTDEATIMKIIEPVVMAPLRREWERHQGGDRGSSTSGARGRARRPRRTGCSRTGARAFTAISARGSAAYRVLDPACGSGNFLALSLRALKDFDLAVMDEAEALGLPPDDQRVGPEAVLGIEINALRRRTRAADGVDHRTAMAVAQQLRPQPPADPRQARRHRARRRAVDAERQASANGRRRMSSSAIRRFSAAS